MKERPLDVLLRAIEKKGGAVDRALLLELLIKNDLQVTRKAPRKEKLLP